MIVFSTPSEFSTYMNTHKRVPAAFEILLSSEVVRVFHEQFIDDMSATAMTDSIEGLPKLIAKNWRKEFDLFVGHLSRGRFVVVVSDFSVLNYILHHAYGHVENDSDESLDECLDLFDPAILPINECKIYELHGLLSAISLSDEFITKQDNSLEYTGNLPQFMRYIEPDPQATKH